MADYSIQNEARLNLYRNQPLVSLAGPQTWGGDSQQTFEVSDFGSTGLSHTQYQIDGTLDFTGVSVAHPLTVLLVSDTIGGFATLQNFDVSQPYAWTFADASGGLTGFDPAAIVFDSSDFSPTADRRGQV